MAVFPVGVYVGSSSEHSIPSLNSSACAWSAFAMARQAFVRLASPSTASGADSEWAIRVMELDKLVTKWVVPRLRQPVLEALASLPDTLLW